MWLYEPEPFIHYTQATGYLDLSTVEAIREAGDPIYARGRRVWAIHDWADVIGYDPRVRPFYVQWCFARRLTFAGSYVLATSKILGMSVALTGLAISTLGTPIGVVRERAEFNKTFLEIARGPGRTSPTAST
jgi:hypothetical protein